MSEPIFYDCQDSESLTYTDPDEAVESYLDVLCDPPYLGGTPEKNRAKFPKTITVTGFRRMPINSTILDAQNIVENLLEQLDEEHSDPDGDATKATPAMLAAAEALVKAIGNDYEVWNCEPCERIEVNVEQWLVEHPEFFDGEGQPAGAQEE